MAIKLRYQTASCFPRTGVPCALGFCSHDTHVLTDRRLQGGDHGYSAIAMDEGTGISHGSITKIDTC